MKAGDMFLSLNVALLGISDRRDLDSDSGGQWLVTQLVSQGHVCVERLMLRPSLHHVRAQVAAWIVRDDVDAVVVHGGTGLSRNDVARAALTVLFDECVEGFGEEFRRLSFASIGSSALQSRAFAGVANDKPVFVVPSSQQAIALAWQHLIAPQLDARTAPCNFATQLHARKARA